MIGMFILKIRKYIHIEFKCKFIYLGNTYFFSCNVALTWLDPNGNSKCC